MELLTKVRNLSCSFLLDTFSFVCFMMDISNLSFLPSSLFSTGQIWEAANMSKLWNLPMVFCIENNHYGMGTSTNRHSCNDVYYTMGGRTIPGIRMNGEL